MNNLEFMWNLADIEDAVNIIKTIVIIALTFYTYIRICNIKEIKKNRIILILISSIIVSILTVKIEKDAGLYYCLITRTLGIAIINKISFKKETIFTIIMTIISLAINYIMYIFASGIEFFPSALFMIKSNYINLAIILLIYIIIVYRILKTRKLKNGLSFLQKGLENEYINTVLLNTCIIILFLNAVLQDVELLKARTVGATFVILAVFICITLKKSFDVYYKQTQLEKNYDRSEKLNKEKDQKILSLEKEQLKTSGRMHTLDHKLDLLKHKMDKLLKLKSITKEEKDELISELEAVTKEMHENPKELELDKTEIDLIDEELECKQSECIKENINFEVQLKENINFMVKHIITAEELQTLLADHIKDAIIAIKHSDNPYRSIMVRFGKIDGIYSLYIYDTGIEFEQEVLEKLGKEPITTHKDSGGTGLGFFNTFETLRKYQASLIIEEIGKPCADNYTKIIKIRFDNKNEFKIESYKMLTKS